MDQRIALVPTQARPGGVTAAVCLSCLAAVLFAANALVSLATISTAWRHYGDAYPDLPHDATAIAGTQLTVAFSLVMDVLLALLAAIATIRVLNGRRGRRLMTVIGGLGVLRLCCANLLISALAQPSMPDDQVAADLKNAVPIWAQHTMSGIETAIGLALITVIILMATPTSKAHFAPTPPLPGHLRPPSETHAVNPAFPLHPGTSPAETIPPQG